VAKSGAMPGKSYEELRRLARIWFTEAREKSAPDDAEFADWTAERRQWNADGAAADRAPHADDGSN
jgi:hypothetical protein